METSASRLPTLQVRHPEWEAYHSKGMCGKRPGYQSGWWDIADGKLLEQWQYRKIDSLRTTWQEPPQRKPTLK